MSNFADNYGEQQAYRAGLGDEDSDPKDFCAETGDCSRCDGEMGACTCSHHEAAEELTKKTFEFFAADVERRRKERA